MPNKTHNLVHLGKFIFFLSKQRTAMIMTINPIMSNVFKWRFVTFSFMLVERQFHRNLTLIEVKLQETSRKENLIDSLEHDGF